MENFKAALILSNTNIIELQKMKIKNYQNL